MGGFASSFLFQRLDEAYLQNDWSDMPPFEALVDRIAVLRRGAEDVARKASEPGPSHPPHWRCHWVSVARSAWGRGRLDVVELGMLRVLEVGGLFLTEAGQLRAEISGDEVAVMLSQS